MDPGLVLFLSILGALVFWLIIGSFGAYVSMEKGRPWFEGFLFAMFMGPLGVVAAACLPMMSVPEAAPKPASFLTKHGDDVGDPDELERFLKRR